MRLIFLLFFLKVSFLFAQEEKQFTFQCTEQPLTEILPFIEEQCDVKFSYADTRLVDKKITLQVKAIPLKKLLTLLSIQTTLDFDLVNKRYIIIKNSYQSQNEINVLEEVILSEYLVEGIKKTKDASYKIQPEVLSILPGLTIPDALESILELPGVTSPGQTASGLVVRGGETDQNRIMWDDINIYHKGHMFGMISPLNSNLIKEINFYNKGTDPKFGERISSVIDIKSKQNISDTLHFGVGINAINNNAYLEAPLIKDKLGIQIGLRSSFRDLYNSYTLRTISEKVFQNSNISSVNEDDSNFRFGDANLKLIFSPDTKNKISLSALVIDSSLDYNFENQAEDLFFQDKMGLRNWGFSLNYERIWSTNIKQTSKFFFSEYDFTYNQVRNQELETVSDFKKKNTIFDSGLSTNFDFLLKENDAISLGYQYVLKDVKYQFSNTTDFFFIIDSDEAIIRTHSFYGNYKVRSLGFADLNIGIRANYYSELNSFRLEPRFQLNKKLSKTLVTQFTAEGKNQIINEIDETVLSDINLENRVWRLANGDTSPIINSYQFSAGLLYNLDGWQIDTDLYTKNITGKTALSLGFLNQERTVFNIGEQKILGGDLLVRKSFKPFKIWLSYSYNQIENKFDTLNQGKSFKAGVNVEHNLATTLTYRKKRIQFSLGWKWNSGRNYAIPNFNEDNTIDFESISTQTTPNFHRLDFSSLYNFNWSTKHKLKGKIGLSARNIYNNQNLINTEYVSNNDLDNSFEIINQFGIGFTPNLLLMVYL